MAIPNTMLWRVRAGGSNVNGGGYDPATSGVLSTTLTGAISAGDTTITIASATGWPASGNYYARIGKVGREAAGGSSEMVQVTGGQGTTTLTIARGQRGTTALAHASGTVFDNDQSQCDSAFGQSDGTSNASTTFTSALGAFKENVVGNVLWLGSGTNSIPGPYLITGYTNATTITLDRNCSTGAMTNGMYKIGGAWADPKTNCESTTWIKPGNIIYIRAGGSGSVASPDYGPLSNFINVPAGDATNGKLRIIGENGRPYIKSVATSALLFNGLTKVRMQGLYGISNGTGFAANGIYAGNESVDFIDCIADQNGNDCAGIVATGGVVDSCEVWSSTANAGSAGTQYAIDTSGAYGARVKNCNIHNTWGPGILVTSMADVSDSILSNCKGDSVHLTAGSSGWTHSIRRCTIDAGQGHGIVFNDATALLCAVVLGNIISNHTGGGKYGVACNFGTTAANDRIRGRIDYNAFYNNTADAQNLTVGTGEVNGSQLHDSIGVDPQFVAQSTQDYAIGTNLKALGFPQTEFLQSKSGQTTGVRSYVDAGGVQRQESASGGGLLRHPGMAGGLNA